MKYKINIKDPDGKNRILVVYEDLPVQVIERDGWEITITKIKRSNGIMIDKVDWERV